MGSESNSLQAVVAGGSIGGLCVGVALRGAGCDVEVFERTPDAMESRGAGIVVQGDLTTLLHQYGAPVLPTTACTHRLYLEPTGGDGSLSAMPQQFTSWEAIYQTLRASFPDTHYHLGSTVSGFDQSNRGVKIHIEGKQDVEADFLVCADGVHSANRRRLLPEVHPEYAGYIAWRGTLPESAAPDGLVAFFEDRFAFSGARSGGHALNYLIPGDGAATEPGRRRLNWVWYVSVPEGPELSRLLTDRTGRVRDMSVPAGMLPGELVAEVHARAKRELHPKFAELIQATPDPFIQSIVDVGVPKMAFGRACLLGDAAFVVRPHTAAAAAKAAADATTLASAVRSAPYDIERALELWETRQLDMGRGLTRYGVALGRRWATAR